MGSCRRTLALSSTSVAEAPRDIFGEGSFERSKREALDIYSEREALGIQRGKLPEIYSEREASSVQRGKLSRYIRRGKLWAFREGSSRDIFGEGSFKHSEKEALDIDRLQSCWR